MAGLLKSDTGIFYATRIDNTYYNLYSLKMNKIIWLPKSLKQLRKIDRQDNLNIRRAVNELMAMPHCQNVKSLTNHEYGYRLRVGRYRVLFDWLDIVRIVEIQEVRKRDEHTY
jgi:mRNA interferase RelE/StbE